MQQKQQTRRRCYVRPSHLDMTSPIVLHVIAFSKEAGFIDKNIEPVELMVGQHHERRTMLVPVSSDSNFPPGAEAPAVFVLDAKSEPV